MFENSDCKTTMNTFALKKEAQSFGPKQILLTLKKGPSHYPRTAVITSIGKELEVKITDSKMIKIPSKNGQDTFLNKRHNLGRFDINDRLRPKLVQVPLSKRKNLLIMKKYSIVDKALTSGSAFCGKFTKVLWKNKKTDDLKKKEPIETLTLNKQDRFIPNILRSTKMGENICNNNSNNNNKNLIRFGPTHTTSSHGTNRHYKDYKTVRRKRKQVLGSPNIKRDWPCSTQVLSNKNDLKKSLLHTYHTEESGEETETLGITVTESEQVNDQKCSEMKPEISANAEELSMDSCDSKDLYSADLNIPYETENLPNAEETYMNCNYDKSIKEIFDEFEVADYQNYIDQEDLGFEIDEMEKLLNSNIDSSLTDSSIFDNSIKISEYDMNGNDIQNHGNSFEKLPDGNKGNARNVQCKIKPCFEDRAETEINISRRLGGNMNVDGICSRAWNGSRSYKRSESNSWSNEFEDHYYNDDFQNFCCGLAEDSFSTDTASESETNEFNSTKTSSLISPKNENFKRFTTSLVVSDVVPLKVFSDDSNGSCSDGLESDDYTVERSLSSSPLMQQYHLSSNDGNNNYCPSLSGIPLERLASKLEFYDDFDASLEMFGDGNFLEDNMLNNNCAFAKEDETCETILANSSAKFDDEHISSIHRNLADLDIENADDIEISRLLSFGNTGVNSFTSVSDVTLQPYTINAPNNELSTDVECQSNANDMFMSSQDNSQFGTMNFENLPLVQAESIPNESTCLDDFMISFDNEVETGLQGCSPEDEDFELSNSTLANISSNCNEFLLPPDVKAEDMDCSTSSSRCSPLLSIESRNITELKMSKLENLLTRKQTYADYSRTHYWSATSGDVITDSRIINTEDCSEVVGHSDFDIPDSATSSYRNCHSQVTDCKSIGDISYSNVIQETNPTTEDTVITINDVDDYSIAKRRNHHPLESESTLNQDSYNCQSISYSASSNIPAPSGKHPVNRTNPKGGIWKDLVKRSKFVAQYISSYIPCDFCENKYSSQAALADHVKLTHRRHRPSRFRFRDRKYVCDKCSKEYMFAAAIEKHFKLHENYTLTCKICEKHFSERIFLKRHVYGIHLNWQLECTYCSRKFSRQNTLSRHIRKCHEVPSTWREEDNETKV